MMSARNTTRLFLQPMLPGFPRSQPVQECLVNGTHVPLIGNQPAQHRLALVTGQPRCGLEIAGERILERLLHHGGEDRQVRGVLRHGANAINRRPVGVNAYSHNPSYPCPIGRPYWRRSFRVHRQRSSA
jgi:hypothetical protein